MIHLLGRISKQSILFLVSLSTLQKEKSSLAAGHWLVPILSHYWYTGLYRDIPSKSVLLPCPAKIQVQCRRSYLVLQQVSSQKDFVNGIRSLMLLKKKKKKKSVLSSLTRLTGKTNTKLGSSGI